MQVALLTLAELLRPPCKCGNTMRLVGIEPQVRTDAEIYTYECVTCHAVEAVARPVLH